MTREIIDQKYLLALETKRKKKRKQEQEGERNDFVVEGQAPGATKTLRTTMSGISFRSTVAACVRAGCSSDAKLIRPCKSSDWI